MTVFKAFLKVLNKCKIPIMIYTVFLIAFGSINLQNSDNSVNFVASKPDIVIINQDEKIGLTNNLIEYMSNTCNVKDIKEGETLDDALFYRDVNYIIYIPSNYRQDFLQGKNPKIEIKSTGDYPASVAEMLLNKYLKTALSYQQNFQNEEQLINNINRTLEKQITVETTSKVDNSALAKATFYYNFANYSLLAGCVYVVCLILSTFKKETIRKRTIISSMKDRKYNMILLGSNALFVFTLWLFYVLLSFILLGNVMFTMHGLFYIINSFVFSFVALTIAFIIAYFITNKEAINGIVNFVALGSSFLCGAFVPAQWLPHSVLTIAHILPSYWYIQTNDLLTKIEIFNWTTVSPLLMNMGIMIVFGIIFIMITNIISRKKRTID